MESERKYRDLFDSIDEGVTTIDLIYDQDGQCIDALYGESNPALERMTGLRDIEGKRVSEVIPDLEPEWLERYDRIVRTGVPERFVSYAKGLGRWLEVFASRVGGEGSRQCIQVYTDVTERKRVESSLRESAEELRYTIEANPYATWTATPEGEMDFSSDRWKAWTGSHTLGVEWQKAQHPDDLPAMLDQWTPGVHSETPFDIEHRVRMADGSYRWMRTRAFSRIGEAGQVVKWYGTTEDIDERKRVSIELRESEERQTFLLKLSDALRPIADPVKIQEIAVNMLGRELQVDRCYYTETDWARQVVTVTREYLGLASYSLVGDHPLALFDTLMSLSASGSPVICDDIAHHPVLAADAAAYRDRGVQAFVVAPLVKDHLTHAFMCITAARPRDWTAGEVELLVQVADRTWAAAERARAETAQRNSEERLRQFGENSPDMLWIVDFSGQRLEYLSAAYERMWGEPRARVMNDLPHMRSHVHPADIAALDERMAKLQAGERATIEYRIIRPDGAQRWIFDTGFPIKDDHGRVTRMAGVAQDLTARREAEDRVRESERRFRTLSEGVPQLVWRAVDHGEWSWASPQWTAFTGQAEAESRGWGWIAAVHPDDRDAARAAWDRSRQPGTFEIGYRLRRAADGHYCWFTTRATAVRDDDGNLVEWLGTSTDVDDLRRLQEHQQLLLGELQHRVRNSLSVMRSIVRRTAATSETVDDFSMHLDGRLASFARIQAAVTRDPIGGIDFRAIVLDELLAHSAREGQQAYIDGPDIKFAPKAGETLALAFHELATNAVKYGALTVPGGVIRVSWRVTPDSAGLDWLAISWDEDRPGPPIPPPLRRGFGIELLEDALSYELDAETLLMFRPTGLLCTISLPLTDGIVLR